eukprot:2074517-Rhodomonas_salina.2
MPGTHAVLDIPGYDAPLQAYVLAMQCLIFAKDHTVVKERGPGTSTLCYGPTPFLCEVRY